MNLLSCHNTVILFEMKANIFIKLIYASRAPSWGAITISKVIAAYVELGLFTSPYTLFYIYPHFRAIQRKIEDYVEIFS